MSQSSNVDTSQYPKKRRFFHNKRDFLSIGLIFVFVGVYILLKMYFPDEYIHNFLTRMGPFGPLVFILISLFVNIFLPTLAPPVVYIGYDLFGKHVVWYISFAAFLNFFTNFWIARTFGRELMEKLIGKRLMKKVDRYSQEYGLVTLFFLRAFQGGIHDLISYSAGLTNLKFWKYILVSIAGMIPGMILWYVTALLFPETLQFFFASTVISTVLTIVFIGGSILWPRMETYLKKKWKQIPK